MVPLIRLLVILAQRQADRQTDRQSMTSTADAGGNNDHHCRKLKVVWIYYR